MKALSFSPLFILVAALLTASTAAFGFELVSMQPYYERFEVFTDEPLTLVFSASLDPTTVGETAVTVDDLKTGAAIAGVVTLTTTTETDDTLVFTPDAGRFPFAHRLQAQLDPALRDLSGTSLTGELPDLGVFVANLPNDLERPEIPPPGSFPTSLFVNANVLLGFNPLDPESDTSYLMNYVPGMSATEAWKMHTGDPDVLIAIIDVGIDSYANTDLSERLFLNRGELPQPVGADQQPCADWDCNGDGRFSPFDYQDDPLVWDTNANDRIDGEDLFACLSDDVDNDGNGYVDDISGWDFFRNVNYACGVSGFPEGVHGRLRAIDAVGVADNGMQNKPGFCPDCSFISVRVGEAIMTEFNLMTTGMQYAVDMGADVVIVAMGVANYNYTAEMAFKDAFDSGVFVVAASGDELGFHHIYPAAGEDMYSVKAVMPLPPVEYGPLDLSKLAFVESYCTNYGAHIDATGVTGACSSEATSNIAGIAGLLLSYGRSLGLELSPGELRQLLNMTVDDIKDSCLAFNMKGCREGWEETWGYGRINANKAMLRLGDPLFGVPERIPPDVRIWEPRWWTTYDPNKQSQFDVTGMVYARGRPYTWSLQLGFGVEPWDAEFIEIATGSGTDVFEGAFATIDIMNYVDDAWLRRLPKGANDFTVTLRVQAWWTPEGDEPVLGEFRKAIAWHTDDDPDTGLRDDFPKNIGAAGASPPVLYDLDGDADGALEIVFATARPSVDVYKYDPDTGAFDDAPGFPVELPGNAEKLYEDSVIGSVAVGQVFGDGVPYIAVASNHGLIYLIHPDGNLHDGGPFVHGFPVSALEPDNTSGFTFAHGNGFLAAPALADLDGDGLLEIIAASYDQHAYAWKVEDGDGDGLADAAPGWPVLLSSLEEDGLVDPDKYCDTGLPAQVLGSPAAAILMPNHADPDIAEYPAVVVPTSESCNEGSMPTGRVYAVYWNGMENEDGPFLPDWPAVTLMPLGDELPIPPLTIGMTSSPALAIKDGELLVGVGSFFWIPQLIHWDGSRVSVKHLPFRVNLGVTANGSFGRFGEDNNLWYFFPTAGFIQGTENGFKPAAFNICGWDLDNLKKMGWRKNFEDINFFVTPVIADLDYDGDNEVVAGSGGYLVHATDFKMDEPEGWPKFTQNWLTSAVTVGDADGDRLLDVTAVTQEGNFWMWNTRGPSCHGNESTTDWPRFHHDPLNSGMYGLDGFPPRLVRDLVVYTTDNPDIFEIHFTAPGDDEDCGTAALYDLRYTTDGAADLRDPAVWQAAAAVEAPAPIQGGDEVVFTVELPGATRFAMRSYDDAGWISHISNLAEPQAPPPPTDDDDDNDNDDDDDNDDLSPTDDDDDDDDTGGPSPAGGDDDDDDSCGC